MITHITTEHNQSHSYKRTMTHEAINELADKFEAAGVTTYSDEGKKLREGLDYGDYLQLQHVLHERTLLRSILNFDCSAPMKSFLLGLHAKRMRGLRAPQKQASFESFGKAAAKTTDQWHKQRAPWQAKGDKPLILLLKEAVCIGYSQESYADHSSYLIPCRNVAGRPLTDAELKQCSENVGRFFQYADTHTGMAGSGSNWSAFVTSHEGEYFVHVECRASIMD